MGGLVNETYIGKVWLEGIDINSGLSEEELGDLILSEEQSEVYQVIIPNLKILRRR